MERHERKRESDEMKYIFLEIIPTCHFLTSSAEIKSPPNCSPTPAPRMTVENPGDAEVEVDTDTLKASLACPICNDMYRFPVTVVSYAQRDSIRAPFLLHCPEDRIST